MLRDAVRKVLAARGLSVVDTNYLSWLKDQAHSENAFGWKEIFTLAERRNGPTTIIDIGANRGQFSRLALDWFGSRNDCRIHAFEPLPPEFFEGEQIDDPRVHVHRHAVGGSDSTLRFHVHLDHSTSSSAHPTEQTFNEYWPQFGKQTREIEVSQVMLDPFLAQLPADQGFDAIDLLKIDAQGHELEVLAGATETLKRTRYISTEVTLIPIYAGGALADRVCSTLNSQGFRLVRGWGPHLRKSEVVQLDFLFVNEKWNEAST